MKDYYSVLDVPKSATTAEIRKAYQKAALRTHPDRHGGETTQEFQLVADAYYVLSNPVKRREYDALLKSDDGSVYEEMTHANADHVFGDVFEELLRPEVANPGWFWWFIGMLAGFMLGFIIANIPGMMFGGYIGGKLGSIRDNKGKPVAEVFQGLQHQQRVQVLQHVARKILIG